MQEKSKPGIRKKTEGLEPANSLLVHDVKNLSFRLGALLQNLDTHYEDPLFKKSVVDILTDTVKQMDKIVRRCRDRRGEIIVKMPLDLNEILNELINSLPTHFRKPNGMMIVENYSRLPKIWGDPEFLQDAFAILIQNALEAMEEEGGRLTLTTGYRTTATGKRKVFVKIADTGLGISREFLSDGLFSPFVSTKETGLGMGLYTCRNIISLHEGTINVYSRGGRGTTFRVAFPAREGSR